MPRYSAGLCWRVKSLTGNAALVGSAAAAEVLTRSATCRKKSKDIEVDLWRFDMPA